VSSGPITADQIGAVYDSVFWLQTVINGGNRHIGVWEDDVTSMSEAGDRLTDLLISRLDVGPGTRVLDVGSGTGRPLVRLAKQKPITGLGITVASVELDAACQQIEEAGLTDRLTVEKVELAALEAESESFDRIWAVESILHLDDLAGAVAKLYDLLRPGGKLVISDYVEVVELTPEQRALLSASVLVGSFMPPGGYVELVEKAGFVNIATEDLTPHVRRTAVEVVRQLERERAQLEERMGAAVTEQAIGAAAAIAELAQKAFAYDIVVAEKPARR
jgi:cyclopropane fatty-acyl-phospholipid synthase-like methyltransferase